MEPYHNPIFGNPVSSSQNKATYDATLNLTTLFSVSNLREYLCLAKFCTKFGNHFQCKVQCQEIWQPCLV